jgi:hypothetical protein
LFFLLAGNSFFVFWGSILLLPSFVIFFGLFLYVVHLSVDAKYKRDKTLALISINENELKVIDGDWSMFEDGSEFRDRKHPFTLDMDIFGKKSVFQLLNRTVSLQGKEKLAQTLAEGSSTIELNAICITDLADEITWCQEFMSEGLVRKGEYQASLKDLSKVEIQLSSTFTFLRFFLPIIAFSAIVLLSIGMISSSIFAAILVVNLAVVAQGLKRTNSVANSLTSQSERVKVILKQLELYSNLSVKHELFKKEQDQLLNEGIGVIHEVRELDKIMGRFDVRINFLVGILFGWNIIKLFICMGFSNSQPIKKMVR